MKKIKYFIVLIISILVLSSCSGKPKNVTDYVKKINESIREVSSVNITAVVTDQSIEVYKLEQAISVTSRTDTACSGQIVSTTHTLSDGFVFADNTQTTVFNDADLSTLFNYNMIDENFVNTPTIDNLVLTGQIAQDKANDFFKVTNLRNKEDVSVTFTLQKKNRLESYSITYTTTTNKNVVISGSYSYE